MKHATYCVVLFALLTASGCVSNRFVGEAAQVAAGARVTLMESTDSGVYITRIDGKSPGMGIVKSYTLAPGIHELSISIMGPVGINGQSYGSVRLRHDFAAGGRYSVQSQLSSGRYRVWIRDEATGRKLPPAATGL